MLFYNEIDRFVSSNRRFCFGNAVYIYITMSLGQLFKCFNCFGY